MKPWDPVVVLWGDLITFLVVLVFLWLVLHGCATGPTAGGIARDLAAQLDMQRGQPLALRCQTVRDAERRCQRAGLDRRCFADGWNDADRDGWTLAACERGRP